MSRLSTRTYSIPSAKAFADRCMVLSEEYDFFARLENNDISYPFQAFPNYIAFGCKSELILDKSNGAFDSLADYQSNCSKPIFGYLSYDLKNDIHDLESAKIDHKGFPKLAFFEPDYLLEFKENAVEISGPDPDMIYNKIVKSEITHSTSEVGELMCDIEKEQYINTVQKLRDHIRIGDFYEINYCMEYYGKTENFNSYQSCLKLWEQSPTPFSSYIRIRNYHLICASPERFIKRSANKLISQPIKGTIRTGDNPEEKARNRIALQNSEKERAENMMIVDLVRNDLAMSSKSGSVKVEEMFGIYEFRHLFQMISTVSSEISNKKSSIDAIRNAFPMGSMTGAPKKKVMEMIDHYEKSSRGIFSGSAGLIYPDGDFDFNVIIRSLFYNNTNKSLSYSVGGAITYDSDPEDEYEECMLKAKSIRDILSEN